VYGVCVVVCLRGWEASRNAFECVFAAVAGERVVVVCDDAKVDVGRSFAEGALALGLWTRFLVLDTSGEFRKEVPRHLLEVLSGQKPDLYVNLLRGVGEEVPFRIKLIHLETRSGRVRLGHCPGVSSGMLTDGALALTAEEHRSMQGFAGRLMRELGQPVEVEVVSPLGTDVSFSVVGREFFTDTVVDWKTLRWMNLPTGEVIVAPVEDSLEGRLVCDVAVGGVGRLKSPVEVSAKKGEVVEVVSEDKEALKQVSSALGMDEWAKVVGEFAFGINPKAKSLEEFLEAEKILGTIHFAFGHNTDMPGGMNVSSNHMDFLVSRPTVKVTGKDGETKTVLRDGKFEI
jgi:aminopeptidase